MQVMLTHFIKRGGVIDDSDNDGGGGVGGNDMYRERVKPMLVLLSNSYSELDEILVSGSRPFFYPAYTVLLTTFYY